MEKTFHEWYCELYELAKSKNCEWLIPPEKDYPTDGYDDANTPAEELSELISYGSELSYSDG